MVRDTTRKQLETDEGREKNEGRADMSGHLPGGQLVYPVRMSAAGTIVNGSRNNTRDSKISCERMARAQGMHSEIMLDCKYLERANHLVVKYARSGLSVIIFLSNQLVS